MYLCTQVNKLVSTQFCLFDLTTGDPRSDGKHSGFGFAINGLTTAALPSESP